MTDFEAALDQTSDLHRARRDRDYYRRQAERLEREAVDLRRALGLVEATRTAAIQPPKWLTPTKHTKGRATAVAMLSDSHFDEVVRTAEVDGINAYNRRIGELRLRRWAEKVVELGHVRLHGHQWDGLVVILGGDIFSGDIHEELRETNEDTALGSLLHWCEQICAALDLLAGAYGTVHVASVPGNHGRTTRKPRAKLRARTNFDWLLAKMVERHFAADKRVTFEIPEASDVHLTIYGWHHHVTHGDQVTGGAGIGGIWPPIMRLRARKSQRQQIDTLWMGHWHQLIQTPFLVVNGALKGWDEYAAVSNFQPEVPQQAFAVVTPEHNITWQAPVLVADRKAEGW